MVDNISPVNPVEKESQKVEDIFETGQNQEVRTLEVKETQPAERTRETVVESIPEKGISVETEDETGHIGKMTPAQPIPAAPVAPKNPELVKIETVLSEHLDELFIQMTPDQQIVFQQKGEITASKIANLMQEVKLKVRDVLNLIKEWLRFIPGINKFFLEQEAKIKTDRLLAIHEQKYKQK